MPPAAGGGGSPQQQGDNSLAPFWILICLFAIGWATWYFAHAQIAMVVLRIKLVEAQFLSFFISGAGDLVNLIKSTPPADAKFNDIASICNTIGYYLRYPVMIIMLILAAVMYFGSPNLRYKKTYSMHTLMEAEKENWPQITPVANLDLVSEDIDVGPWAMAMTPMQFAKKNNLLQEERVINTDPNQFNRPRITAVLRREDAYRVFSLQLGKYWNGVENLNIHTKALFAIFAARANLDREGATKLVLQIAASTASGKLDFSGVEELLAKHKNNKAVIKVTEEHAFILTVMTSMLLLGRSDGVLASADFLWLKPVDRSLWFMLNSVGRQTPFTEVSGPYAHWLAEHKLGRKLMVAVVEEAVNALDAALKDIIYKPDVVE